MSAEAMSMLSGAAQGGSNAIENFMPFISEIWNWANYKGRTNEQRRYNEQQVDKQWRRMVDQWNRENTYNDPRQVIARMRDAGVNPALAYMNGASFAPSAASPQPSRNQGQATHVPLDPQSIANTRLLNSQAKLNEAQASEAMARIPTYQKSIEQMAAYIEFLGNQSVLFASQAELNKKYGDRVAQEIYGLQLENEKMARSMEDSLRKIKAEADAAEFNSQKLKIELDQYADQLKAQRENLKAQAYAAIQSGRLSAAECDKVRAEIARYDEVVDAQLANCNADVVLKKANASEASARAATEDAMRDSRVSKAEKEAKMYVFESITKGSAQVISASAQLVSSFKPGVTVNRVDPYVSPAGSDIETMGHMFD